MFPHSSSNLQPSLSFTQTQMAKMSIFLNYLKQLKPLLTENFTQHQNSTNKIIRNVAQRPDFLLPFRQKAPTILRALQTIYSQHERLCKPEGFWNVLNYRGVFYGSPYALSDDRQWHNNLNEWKRLYESSTKTKKGDKAKYYVNIGAYGLSNPGRSITCITSYWNERHRWTSFLQQSPTVTELYEFLSATQQIAGKNVKIFTNIGPLTALLICGDLIEAGIFPMPSIQEWASLIYCVNKGASKGLSKLNLIHDTYTKSQLTEAFQTLHNFLLEHLSQDEQIMMGYNIVMLEHALCKFTRILPKERR